MPWGSLTMTEKDTASVGSISLVLVEKLRMMGSTGPGSASASASASLGVESSAASLLPPTPVHARASSTHTGKSAPR